MERKINRAKPMVKSENTGLIRYRKIGGGVLRLNNRIIKPNQVFLAGPHEIPAAFKRFVIILSEPADIAKAKEVLEDQEKQFAKDEDVFVLKSAGKGLWNVINTVDKKAINEKPLEKKAAQALKESLEG